MRVVYCAQFRDYSGYGVAARGYLKSLDEFLQQNPQAIDLKIYSAVVGNNPLLSDEEISLLKKYEFKNDGEINEYLNSDYLFVWHMPPAMIAFSDEKFSPSPNCSPSIKKLWKASSSNINLSVWETNKIPREYVRAHEYYNPNAIITCSEWNKEAFDEYIDCHIVPHLIEEPSKKLESSELPYDMDNTFTIFSMSQWSRRKGFDVLIQAFVSEFGSQDDVRLLLKTYPSAEANMETIQEEIKFYRSIIRMPNKANNIILIPGFMPDEKINWFYDKCDAFALFSRGEGFSLPIAESLMRAKPVIVPKEGGHIDYISDEAAFFVDGQWDTCICPQPPYDVDGEWYQCNITSARKQLRKAYNMWKEGTLKAAGQKGREHILASNYDKLSVGQRFYDVVKKVYKPTETKIAKIKKQVALKGNLEEKLKVLRNSFEGETCYILNCGPSIKDIPENIIKDKLKDKLVFSIKQAYNKFPEITDFHFFNCANLPALKGEYWQEHYNYGNNEPFVVASSNYNIGMRWSPYQKYDVFFKVPIRTEINNEFVTKTKKFEDFLIEKSAERPCGPGIMYETVIYMALHLGVKKIVAIGWDLSNNNPNKQDDYEHFYGNTDKLFNRGDILPWEVKVTCEASKDLYEWLSDKGVELELISNKSSLYEGIPRVKL